eukprot:m.81829 g.81829  ORF g.81829 m.81829 type:complete len:96 (-) comp12831_c0_seq4:162-449(-)
MLLNNLLVCGPTKFPSKPKGVNVFAATNTCFESNWYNHHSMPYTERSANYKSSLAFTSPRPHDKTHCTSSSYLFYCCNFGKSSKCNLTVLLYFLY